MLKIKKNDIVQAIKGKDAGKKGKDPVDDPCDQADGISFGI